LIDEDELGMLIHNARIQKIIGSDFVDGSIVDPDQAKPRALRKSAFAETEKSIEALSIGPSPTSFRIGSKQAEALNQD